eukprot:COSAG03_NODE_6719_length_1015_cov_3.682226_1_plen_197_part_01
MCSQSSVGLRRHNSLSSPPPRPVTTSRLAERERRRQELGKWRHEMRDQKRLFEEKMREQRRLFEEQQRQWMAKVTKRENELRLEGRQVLENFIGHGEFRGTVIRLDGQNSQGLSMYKVRYTDGTSHNRSEDKVLRFLVDRHAEDHGAKQKIAEMSPSSDEEEEEEEEEEVMVEGEEHQESTQPFVDDENVDQEEESA